MSEEKMTIAVRTIYYYAITPATYILDLDMPTWRTFLYATPLERKDIVVNIVGRNNLTHQIREIAWIPLSGQEQLVVSDKVGTVFK